MLPMKSKITQHNPSSMAMFFGGPRDGYEFTIGGSPPCVLFVPSLDGEFVEYRCLSGMPSFNGDCFYYAYFSSCMNHLCNSQKTSLLTQAMMNHANQCV
jgi:hypothetical protein